MSKGYDARAAEPDRLAVLDGVRALGILLVLANHWLPLSPLWRSANESVGMLGVALFFILSGYLITGQLLRRGSVLAFVVRRLARILPLAWLCAFVVALLLRLDGATLVSHLLFYANLPPQTLTYPLEHFWSLCVEIQFYSIAAILLWLRPALTGPVLLLLLLGVTVFCVATGSNTGSITWVRGGDILAGGVLVWMLWAHPWCHQVRRLLSRPAVLWVSGALLCASCVVVPGLNPLSYVRSYAAAVWVGALVCQPTSVVACQLAHRRLGYVATVSYAVYVLHMPLMATWLGSGDLLEKYLKRPLLAAATFTLAHLSTFYFERRFIDWGRRCAQRYDRQRFRR